MSKKNIIKTDTEYKNWLKELKNKVRTAQIRAAVKVNTELLKFYWELGAEIVEKQKTTSWGDGFLKQLSKDLSAEFPDIKGFSHRNIKYIKQWYLFWNQQDIFGQQLVAQIEDKKSPQFVNQFAKQVVSQLKNEKGQQLVAKLEEQPIFKIPWGHNLVIISKTKSAIEALFYVQNTVENGWSRNVLVHQIEADLFNRKGKAISNLTKLCLTNTNHLYQV